MTRRVTSGPAVRELPQSTCGYVNHARAQARSPANRPGELRQCRPETVRRARGLEDGQVDALVTTELP